MSILSPTEITRRAEVVRIAMKCRSIAEAARQLGLSRERVRQILRLVDPKTHSFPSRARHQRKPPCSAPPAART